MPNFQFTVSNGAVTAVAAVDGARAVPLRVPANATFAIDAGTITETLTSDRGVQTLTFTQSAADPSLYALTASALTLAQPSVYAANGVERGLNFTIADGVVTAVQESISYGSREVAREVRLSPTDQFAVSAAGVVETRLHDNVVETIAYVQPPGETLYAVASVSTKFIDGPGASTLLSIHDDARLSVTVSAGAVTAVQTVSPSGATAALNPIANVAFTQPEAGFVVETITRGGRTVYDVFYDGGGDGVYTQVAHGAGSVDLVGLKAQLAQIDAALIALL